HGPVKVSEILRLMTSGTTHRMCHGGAVKWFPKPFDSVRRTRSTEPRAKFCCIKILVKTWRAVCAKAFIDRPNCILLVWTHAARCGKDRENAALVTLGAVVIVMARFPAAFYADRTIPLIC